MKFSWWRLFACLLLVSIIVNGINAQQGRATVETRRKLPSPEAVINDYVKALGGKKRLAAIKDVTSEWKATEGGATAVRREKTPASLRTDLSLPNGEVNYAASARSAWRRGTEGDLRTLTDAESFAAKLAAMLEASNFVNWKKLNVLARTVGVEQLDNEPAYQVEFSTREGAKMRAWFSASSKLLLKLFDPLQQSEITFSEYKAQDGVLMPHRMMIREKGMQTTFALQSARYNTGVAEAIFDPPSVENINIPDLLREVARNQKELDERISEYTFTRRETEREINDRGELKREKVRVHEVYPVRGGGRVLKLISEDGVALSPERMAKEEKRVTEDLEKAERDYQKEQEKRARNSAAKTKRKGNETGMGKDGDDDFEGISAFLRACEFVAPRREMFRGRETIVFDFRPRANFRPQNSSESLISKLIGVVWIDPQDKQVMRLEARLSDGFKVGGGLLASVRSGSAFAFEQTRMTDGVWLPRMAQINASVKVLLVAGLRLDAIREYSEYKKFNTEAGDVKLNNK